MNRRTFIETTGKSALLATAGTAMSSEFKAALPTLPEKGKIHHSLSRWCYGGIELNELCKIGKEIGLESIELINLNELEIVQKNGLACAMLSFPTVKMADGIVVGGIGKAFNRVEHHDLLVSIYEPYIKKAAEKGVRNVICFSGNSEGMSKEEGLKNCEIGLKKLLPLAEKQGVVLVMELLNSKWNHIDYMCDHSAWGVELCKRISSENFGLLYDIFHMQIMEGDVIQTIRDNHKYFVHYHTAGVPGRNELDENQELYYPAIMKAILATGYAGYVGQEFCPRKANDIESLKKAIKICTV